MAFTHVLIPTDFSEAAQRALRYPLEEGIVYCAKVTLLHVLPAHRGTDVYFITGFPGTQLWFDPTLGPHLRSPLSLQPMVVLRDHNAEALTQLRDLMPTAFHGAWEAEATVGPPAETVGRVAHKHDIDIIVMGTHKHTGLQHMLLDGVATKVVRLAPCPILMVIYSAHVVHPQRPLLFA